MGILERTVAFFGAGVAPPAAPRVAPQLGAGLLLPGEQPARHTERGFRTTPSEQLELLYLRMEPSFALRATIDEIRRMDESDGRVKRIHERTARAAAKGGLKIKIKPTSARVIALWGEFKRRVQLDNPMKLESDLRGLMMEGNVPVQWVLDTDRRHVVSGLRMPTETIKPRVLPSGVFENVAAAYEQWDWLGSQLQTTFALWQLTLGRLRPGNFDNWGSMGRPYLDASRTVWRQLVMTEKDLVVRRHTRAPQRLAHVLEGANQADLDAYEQKITNKQGLVTTDFFMNKKGGVTPVQGDANLDHIADVEHLLDTFFAGSPAPKGLFGYVGDLARDVLEDLKRDYYEELDSLQDTMAFVYQQGFRLDLLLHGINPDAEEFTVGYAERRTDTPNQLADLSLKYQALGVSPDLVWRSAGLDEKEVIQHGIDWAARTDPYPMPNLMARAAPAVKITPGNRPKGESATAISNA